MFEAILASVPRNRSDMVNDLDLPDDITVAPYVWTELDEVLDTNDSLSTNIGDYDVKTISTDSSLALSRAMTDSEIDYDRYRRLKSRSFSDPWIQMRVALDAFPTEYLDSLKSFQSSPSDLLEEEFSLEGLRHAEELRLKMERFIDEECRVFTPDDPGLLALEEALQGIDLQDSDFEPCVGAS